MTTYTYEQVLSAMNRGADDVISVFDDGTEDAAFVEKQDAVNLTVNAGMHYLRNPSATLDDAIRHEYGTSPDDVKEWVRG